MQTVLRAGKRDRPPPAERVSARDSFDNLSVTLKT
jgi:hypothetical protein